MSTLARGLYKHKETIRELIDLLTDIIDDNTIICCIGTDRSIGDSLGPLVGTLLKESNFSCPVYGTLEKPIHALNMYESLDNINTKHPGANIIAIDACLGPYRENIGEIRLRSRPISPGAGVGKKLPQVGNYSLIGIVDTADNNNKFSFNNVRLHFIREFAQIIAGTILTADNIRCRKEIRQWKASWMQGQSLTT